MMAEILENVRIDRIARRLVSPPHRINGIHEADAEIVSLGGSGPFDLAITADAISEEVESGLYADPWFAGWMLAMSNFSDLAAVGADPLGLMMIVSCPQADEDCFLEGLAEGVSAACRSLGTYVLGGDTNGGDRIQLAGCAVGLVPRSGRLTRIGARPGDRIYLSGPAGLGNVFAFLSLDRRPGVRLEQPYRPVARVSAGALLRGWATSVMDTSDGLVHTLDTLMRLNGCRMVVESGWSRILHPEALRISRLCGFPAWLALAAVHGEFELCFTVRKGRETRFLEHAEEAGWSPLPIGEVEAGTGVFFRKEGGLVPLDTARIRNASESAGSDPRSYLQSLFEVAAEVSL
jgi:thiamine-monophosphate kinase